MRLLASLLLMCCSLALPAQIRLDLKQCLELGVDNNLNAQRSGNQLSAAEIALVQARFDFLPQVNLSVGVFRNIGTTVDNFTQQIAQSPTTTNPSLNSSIVLFNGFSRWNGLEAAKYDLKAARYSLEDLRNDIRVNVALAFFQAIFNQENLSLARDRQQLIARQLERTQNLADAGAATKGDVLGLKAQLATEKVNVVNARNATTTSLTNLILALNLDPTESYELVRPEIDGLIDEVSLEGIASVFQSAESFNPGLRQQEALIRSNEFRVKIAKASLYPTLSLGYGIQSFYSSNARETLGFTADSLTGIRPVYGKTIPLFSQLSNNFNQGIGLSLNVPLFNNYRLRQNYLQSELNVKTALIDYEIVRNELYNEVLTAHQDAEAARSRLDAAREQVDAIQESFAYDQSRYDSGLIDFYTYMESLNNKTRADNELLQARYDYVLKRKVLDLYQGKTLDF